MVAQNDYQTFVWINVEETVLSEDTQLKPEPTYDSDYKVVVDLVNQVRDKLAQEDRQKQDLVWKYRKHK